MDNKKKLKTILSVTGIRSEYDILYPVYKAIEAHPKLSLSLIVTGAHLSKRFGLTVEQIRNDGFSIVGEVENLIDDDHDASRIIGAAIQLKGLAEMIDRVRPDILLAFGDREESINVALVGSYLNIPVVHISGGDRVVGNVDDHVRHATTKLAHLHCTTNEESKERIIKMGEQPFRVYNVGNPGIDRIMQTPTMNREELWNFYRFEQEAIQKPLLLVIQHVISTEIEHAYSQMKTTLEAIKELNFPTVVSYPNSDPGSRAIIECIEEYKNVPFIRTFRNIPRIPFVNTMRHAACMVGNSSAGLLEAPSLKLPVINIGNRQTARLHVDNVSFVPHDTKTIIEHIKRACFDEEYKKKISQCKSPYGDGKASERIVEILSTITLDEKLLIKDITY